MLEFKCMMLSCSTFATNHVEPLTSLARQTARSNEGSDLTPRAAFSVTKSRALIHPDFSTKKHPRKQLKQTPFPTSKSLISFRELPSKKMFIYSKKCPGLCHKNRNIMTAIVKQEMQGPPCLTNSELCIGPKAILKPGLHPRESTEAPLVYYQDTPISSKPLVVGN